MAAFRSSQAWTQEDAAAAAAAAKGKLRDNQKMLTRSERTAVIARTNTQECTRLVGFPQGSPQDCEQSESFLFGSEAVHTLGTSVF